MRRPLVVLSLLLGFGLGCGVNGPCPEDTGPPLNELGTFEAEIIGREVLPTVTVTDSQVVVSFEDENGDAVEVVYARP
jgi:hypothetical protein